MYTNSHRDILISNIVNYYIRGMEQDNDTIGFIRNVITTGYDQIPLDDMPTDDLQELWDDILSDVEEDEHRGVDSDHPSEYDLGFGEEFPDEG